MGKVIGITTRTEKRAPIKEGIVNKGDLVMIGDKV